MLEFLAWQIMDEQRSQKPSLLAIPKFSAVAILRGDLLCTDETIVSPFPLRPSGAGYRSVTWRQQCQTVPVTPVVPVTGLSPGNV